MAVEELILNGTFDSNLDNWTNRDNGGVSTWLASPGRMNLTGANQNNWARRWQLINTVPEVECDLTFMTKVNPDQIFNNLVGLTVRGGTSIGGSQVFSQTYTDLSIGGTWTQRQILFTPGAGVDEVYIEFDRLIANIFMTTDDQDFDDISVLQEQPASFIPNTTFFT